MDIRKRRVPVQNVASVLNALMKGIEKMTAVQLAKMEVKRNVYRQRLQN